MDSNALWLRQVQKRTVAYPELEEKSQKRRALNSIHGDIAKSSEKHPKDAAQFTLDILCFFDFEGNKTLSDFRNSISLVNTINFKYNEHDTLTKIWLKVELTM